jgi:hypothetical protein
VEILLDASCGLLPFSKESGLGDSNEPSGNIKTRGRAYLNCTALASLYPMRHEDAKAIVGCLKSSHGPVLQVPDAKQRTAAQFAEHGAGGES